MLVMKAFLLLILRTPIGKNISLAMAAYKSKKQLGHPNCFTIYSLLFSASSWQDVGDK